MHKKHLHFSWTLFVISLGFPLSFLNPLLSQPYHPSIDSVITYAYISESDSVFRGRQLIRSIDSVDVYEFEDAFSWDKELEQWTHSNIYTRAYDDMGYQVYYERIMWKPVNMRWEPMYRNFRDYDTNGNKLLEERYEWNYNAEDWKGESKNEFVYNEDGREIVKTALVWDHSETDDWIYESKYVYEYSGDQWLDSMTYLEWAPQEKEWQIAQKEGYEYFFGNGEYPDSSYGYYLDTSEDVWKLGFSKVFSYNVDGNIIENIYSVWRDDRWLLIQKNELDYDNEGRTILSARYDWDPDSLEWAGREKFEYAFNPFGNNTLSNRYRWNAEAKDWVLVYALEETYQETGLKIRRSEKTYPFGGFGNTNEMISEYRYDSEGKLLMLEFIYRNFSTDHIYDHTKAFYHYGLGSHVEDQQQEKICIYPVPVRDMLFISSPHKISSVELIDMRGKIVLSTAHAGEGLNLSELPGGVYLVRMKDLHGYPLEIKKVVKE